MPDPKDDPIAPLPRATLELYRDSLREVRFPDLDFDSLSHTAAELCAAQLEVECIEAALLSARDAVRERAELLKGWVEPDLLVLDDLFLARRISPEAAEVLQTIVHQRYKLHRAIVITSNRVVQDWGKYLADATMATTILDRLMHRCTMLEFEGRSYRLKEAAARLAISPEPS